MTEGGNARAKHDREQFEVLDHIYSRAGRITANKGQRHLRDFEEDYGQAP